MSSTRSTSDETQPAPADQSVAQETSDSEVDDNVSVQPRMTSGFSPKRERGRNWIQKARDALIRRNGQWRRRSDPERHWIKMVLTVGVCYLIFIGVVLRGHAMLARGGSWDVRVLIFSVGALLLVVCSQARNLVSGVTRSDDASRAALTRGRIEHRLTLQLLLTQLLRAGILCGETDGDGVPLYLQSDVLALRYVVLRLNSGEVQLFALTPRHLWTFWYTDDKGVRRECRVADRHGPFHDDYVSGFRADSLAEALHVHDTLKQG